MVQCMLIAVAAALVNNVVLSQFLGLCPFLGVSKKTDTAAGMGAAVIFVIMIASAVTYGVYYAILTPLNLEYLQTIVFILVIAFSIQYSSAKFCIVLIISNAIVDFPLAVSPAMPIEQERVILFDKNKAIFCITEGFTLRNIELEFLSSLEKIWFNFFSI